MTSKFCMTPERIPFARPRSSAACARHSRLTANRSVSASIEFRRLSSWSGIDFLFNRRQPYYQIPAALGSLRSPRPGVVPRLVVRAIGRRGGHLLRERFAVVLLGRGADVAAGGEDVAVLADFFQRGAFAEAGDVRVALIFSLTPALSHGERGITSLTLSLTLALDLSYGERGVSGVALSLTPTLAPSLTPALSHGERGSSRQAPFVPRQAW